MECEHGDTWDDGVRRWCSECGESWLLDDEHDESHPDEQPDQDQPTRDDQVQAIIGSIVYIDSLHGDEDWEQLRIVWANPMVCTPSLWREALAAGTVDERLAMTRYKARGYVAVMERPEPVKRDPASWLKPRARRSGKPGKRK